MALPPSRPRPPFLWQERKAIVPPPIHQRIILSLFDQSGSWSMPYLLAGYNVIRVDLALGRDALTYSPPVRPWGVLAAPPCTVWTNANAHSWHKIPDAQFFESFALVMRSIELARSAESWWCLENPRGRLAHVIGPHQLEIQPWHYGAQHSKRTCLWGNFTPPARTPRIPLGSLVGGHNTGRPAPLFEAGRTPTTLNLPMPKDFRRADPSWMDARRRLRSFTPPEFAHAFFRANP